MIKHQENLYLYHIKRAVDFLLTRLSIPLVIIFISVTFYRDVIKDSPLQQRIGFMISKTFMPENIHRLFKLRR